MVLFKKCVSFFVVIKIMSTFASTNSATLPIEQRTRAELLLLYLWIIQNNRLTIYDRLRY